MGKIVVQFPYFIKKDKQKEIYDNLAKQWRDDGILLVPSGAIVSVFKDEDIIAITFKEEEDG